MFLLLFAIHIKTKSVFYAPITFLLLFFVNFFFFSTENLAVSVKITNFATKLYLDQIIKKGNRYY